MDRKSIILIMFLNSEKNYKGVVFLDLATDIV